MVKVISYTCLHYGKDYLGSAIRSVIDSVDEHHILYTRIGSHGSRTDIPCPDTRDELYAIAEQAAGSKLRWHEGEWAWEGQQRDSIFQYAYDADVILAVDSDEIWSETVVNYAVHRVDNLNTIHDRIVEPKRCRFLMVHAWRSFNRWIIHDPAYPERAIYPNFQGNTVTAVVGYIFHFGYCQRPEIVEYKQLTHGHRGEWRHDVDWFHDKFMANAQIDCHPVGSEYWNPETVDPFTLGLPEWMREHKYANMQVIE